MNNSKRVIEHIKSVILVVLFVTTILLLYLLWGSAPSRLIPSFLFGQGDAEAPAADTLVTPLYVAFGSADGTFRLAKDTSGIYTAVGRRLADYPSESGVILSEISAEQYKEALTGYESLSIYYGFDLDFPGFCGLYGFGSISGSDQITAIDGFAFSDAARESVLLRDTSSGRFFRIVFSAEQNIVGELRDGAELADDVMYPAGDILGGESMALLPLSARSGLARGRFTPKADEDERLHMAEAVFGDTFDFVRRISDSFGNVTYMYGYGQKTFSSSIDGSYEYKAEASGGESAGFLGDLQTALNFAAACGGWDESLKLSAVSIRSGREPSYEFCFVQSAEGVPVYAEHHYAAEITVTGGQVTRYLRSTAILSAGAGGEERNLTDPANVIAANCNHIYNISRGSMLSIDSEEAFEYVSNSVSAVLQGYFRSEDGSELIPCWIIRTDDGACFYFDLYSAAPLGFIKEEE